MREGGGGAARDRAPVTSVRGQVSGAAGGSSSQVSVRAVRVPCRHAAPPVLPPQAYAFLAATFLGAAFLAAGLALGAAFLAAGLALGAAFLAALGLAAGLALVAVFLTCWGRWRGWGLKQGEALS